MLKLLNSYQLILASGSPRRRELLSEIGLKFSVIPSNEPEDQIDGESPKELVERLAALKANSIAEKHQDSWIIGADTIVVHSGTILGKPSDKVHAQRMLSQLQGSTHEVWTGLAVINYSKKSKTVNSSCSQVTMIPLREKQIESYIETGEPMDKAGSYAIQGVGAHLVSKVVGSYSSVVGLDIALTVSILRDLGVVE